MNDDFGLNVNAYEDDTQTVCEENVDNETAQITKNVSLTPEHACDNSMFGGKIITAFELESNAYTLDDKNAQDGLNNDKNKGLKIPLILNLIGLILSFLGAGLVFSVIGTIISLIKSKQKKSQTLRWAIVIGIVAISLNAIYLLAEFGVTLQMLNTIIN